MKLREMYPQAFEDERGTIFVSEDAAKSADWTYEHGDAFLEDVLGWSWADAEDNFALSQQIKRRKAFWKRHPHLRSVCRFALSRYRFTMLFSSIVWRDWNGRISWPTAWMIAHDVCIGD
jgi:hypothetical protein